MIRVSLADIKIFKFSPRVFHFRTFFVLGCSSRLWCHVGVAGVIYRIFSAGSGGEHGRFSVPTVFYMDFYMT